MRKQPHDTTETTVPICNTRRRDDQPDRPAQPLRHGQGSLGRAPARGVVPALGEGTAEEKIERLELALVDEMRRRATPETAEQAADAMWGLVHARDDADPVKQRVTRHHEELARMGHRPY